MARTVKRITVVVQPTVYNDVTGDRTDSDAPVILEGWISSIPEGL